MNKIFAFITVGIILLNSCSNDEIIAPVPQDPIVSACTPNSPDAYWQEIEGEYNNDLYFLIDHDVLWCTYPKLDRIIDSIQLADNISIDKPSVQATFSDLTTGLVLLQVDSVYSKRTNANRLIHNMHQEYSSGLLNGIENNIATFELLFTDTYGHAIVSAEHRDNIVTMNFSHLEAGTIY